MAVPRCFRQRQIEQGGKPLGDVEAAIVERRQRTDRIAELQHQRLAPQPAQPLARACERRRIARELEPERHWQRMLHAVAPDRSGAAMTSGECGEAVDGAVEVGEQDIDSGTQLEHQGGVEDVLGARSPAHVGGGGGVGLGHLGGERVDERDGDVAGRDRLLAQRFNIVALHLGGIGDLIGGKRRHEADGGFRAGERHNEIQHALQARAIVEDSAHGGARDRRRQQQR